MAGRGPLQDERASLTRIQEGALRGAAGPRGGIAGEASATLGVLGLEHAFGAAEQPLVVSSRQVGWALGALLAGLALAPLVGRGLADGLKRSLSPLRARAAAALFAGAALGGAALLQPEAPPAEGRSAVGPSADCAHPEAPAPVEALEARRVPSA